MGRNLEKTCTVCFKTMRGDTLERHMLKHEKGRKGELNMNQKKEEYKDSEILTDAMGVDQNDEMLERSMQVDYTENDEVLERNMESDCAENKRKIELGRRIINIAQRKNMNISLLSKDKQEAIETYEKYGQSKLKRDIKWRGWQKEMQGYLNEKCDRKIFWIVGKEGNEGKSFFQENIQEEFGYERVCAIPLTENERNTFHTLKKLTSRQTEIFFFNIPKGQYMLHENYKILEHIKDGKAMAGKFNSRLLKFKKPNIVIVFSNNEPIKSHLSMDRWRIFKISNDMEHLEERGVGKKKSKTMAKKDSPRRDESDDSMGGDSYGWSNPIFM